MDGDDFPPGSHADLSEDGYLKQRGYLGMHPAYVFDGQRFASPFGTDGRADQSEPVLWPGVRA